MNSFLIKKNSFKISEISDKKFCRFSLCPQDYKKLVVNQNTIKLKDVISDKYKGAEIGSDNYMKFSKYRFLKTVNVTNKFIYSQSSIEYCKPYLGIKPKKDDILIVKDGAGSGLGEVALYKNESENNDFISSGLIGVNIKPEKKFYVLSLLKSQHFKDFININTAQGSTIRHSKLIAYEYEIPFPTLKNHKKPELVEQYISLLTQNIIDKEEQIEKKQNEIDFVVYNELKTNQKSDFKFAFPKKSDLLKLNRIDTGLYTEKYKAENHLIENYKNGFFKIETSKFKSGSTPKVRIFNASNSKFKWVTPTNISDEGFYNPIEKISMPTGNNIMKDCILFINRTSKGKKGEYVGITCFYDVDYYGKGQHNQGLYRIEHLPKNEMLFITAFINSRIMRKICGNISIGSKMKEMKTYDFANLKFPNFENELKNKMSGLYYNKVELIDFNFETYVDDEKSRNQKLGIFQLNEEIIKIKIELKDVIDKIIKEEPVLV